MCTCHNGFTLHENLRDCEEGQCTFDITAPYGEISSPDYPEDYPPNKDCVWHLTTLPGHRIKIMFMEFELEVQQECWYDHVTLYDGESKDSFTLGR